MLLMFKHYPQNIIHYYLNVEYRICTQLGVHCNKQMTMQRHSNYKTNGMVGCMVYGPYTKAAEARIVSTVVKLPSAEVHAKEITKGLANRRQQHRTTRHNTF
jgi:hypothetical protein